MAKMDAVNNVDVSGKIKRLRRVSGVFLFLALSGFIPLLAPYGVAAQWILLLHIAVGVVAIVPIGILFWRHARAANPAQRVRWWNTSMWAGVSWAVLSLSGIWLVAKGVWGIFVP